MTESGRCGADVHGGTVRTFSPWKFSEEHESDSLKNLSFAALAVSKRVILPVLTLTPRKQTTDPSDQMVWIFSSVLPESLTGVCVLGK